MNESLISIVLPCYRAERFLSRILDDVLAQTYREWELIIVSNGDGQEAQLAIAYSYAEKHQNIIIIKSDVKGLSPALNLGMKEAKGKWITFVDADDRIAPNHLALFMEGIDKNGEEPNIVVGGFTLDQPDFGYVSQLALPAGCTKRDLVLDEIGLVRVVKWNKLFRADFARQVQYKYSIHDDTAYCSLQLGRTARIVIIPMTGYRYIQAFSGSQIARYAADCEEAQREITRNMHLLYQQIGLKGEELEKMKLRRLFEQQAECLRNLFKRNCPFSILQKRREVKRFLWADPMMAEAVRYYSTEGKAKSEKMFCLCHKLHSPLLATLLLEALYRYKHSRMHKQ